MKENLINTLKKLISMIEDGTFDDASVEDLSAEIDCCLDNLLAEDFFGTEGQLDPRGDPR